MPAILSLVLPLALLVLLSVCAMLLGVGASEFLSDSVPQAKLIGKLTLILLLISIFPLRRLLKLSWGDLGFSTPKDFLRQFAMGMLLAIATLLPMLLTLYILEIHVWDSKRVWSIGNLSGKIAIALLMSLLIGFGEELLFRGVLLSSLRRKLPLLASIGISSLYFAALHFLKPNSPSMPEQPSIANGLSLLSEAYGNWFNPQILPALLSLFIIGLFLAIMRLQLPNALGLCIGCHSGWVWQIKMFKELCNLNQHSDYLYLVSSYDGVVGPLVSGWLLLAMSVWWHFAGVKNHFITHINCSH